MKSNKKIATASPKKLIALVCQYYGLTIKQLAATAPLSLWRNKVHEEAKQIVCLVLQRHCESEPEALQTTLKELGLDWPSGRIRVYAEKARQKLADGDYCFQLSLLHIEQTLIGTLIGKK